MTTHAFICGSLRSASADIRFFIDVVRLYKALHISNPNALVKVYSNTISEASKVATLAEVADMYQDDPSVIQELDTTGIVFRPTTDLLHDLDTTPFTPADRVLVYLTDHGDNTCYYYGPKSTDVWSPDDFCRALTKVRNAGIPTLICFSFCGSGFWLRSIRFFAEETPNSSVSAVADDTSNSHEGHSFNIFSMRNPQILLGTQFMQKLLTYFSNYRVGDIDVKVQGLHDTLGGAGFGGFYAPNNRADSIWNYFGTHMSAYSSALVRRPDVQYFNLRKTGANVGQLTPTLPSVLARWSPRLQRLVQHVVGVLPFEAEIASLDLNALSKDYGYVKAVLQILVGNAFIIIPEYDGEFSVFILAAYKIPVELVEEGVAHVTAEFN